MIPGTFFSLGHLLCQLQQCLLHRFTLIGDGGTEADYESIMGQIVDLEDVSCRNEAEEAAEQTWAGKHENAGRHRAGGMFPDTSLPESSLSPFLLEMVLDPTVICRSLLD
jgi:hypothetical protein